jgi:zona occludens toxin
MLYLITGKPGAGKTWYAVRQLQKELASGRLVYSDIDGLALDGVLPIPARWQDCKQGALIVYDECQKLFGPDKQQGRSSNPLIADLETHRHLGVDLWFITQHPNLLHAHVRRLIGQHSHVVAVYNSAYVRIYTAGEVIDVDNKNALLDCDCESTVRDKAVFANYTSTVLDTHKARIPRKTMVMLAAVVIGVAFLLWAIPSSFGAFDSNVTHAHSSLPAPGAPAPGAPVPQKVDLLTKADVDKLLSDAVSASRRQTLDEVSARRPMGCIDYQDRCACYQTDGTKLILSQERCRAWIDEFLGVLRSSGSTALAAVSPALSVGSRLPVSGVSPPTGASAPVGAVDTISASVAPGIQPSGQPAVTP